MGMTLLAAFQIYTQQLKPISRKDKEIRLCVARTLSVGALWAGALALAYAGEDANVWAVITKESIAAFISWQAQQSFTFQTIVVRTNGMRKLFELAALEKCLSREI